MLLPLLAAGYCVAGLEPGPDWQRRLSRKQQDSGLQADEGDGGGEELNPSCTAYALYLTLAPT